MTLALAPWLSSLAVASVKGSIILIAALLAMRVMRRSSAEARHAILAIALVAFLIVPIATALVPAWTVELPAIRGQVTVLSDRLGAEAPDGGADAPPTPLAPDLSRAGGSRVHDAVSVEEPWTVPPLPTLLLIAWALGASTIAVRLLVGMIRLRILSTRATMVTDGSWLQTAHAIARRLGLTRGVTLLRGDREAVPMTWGVLSPVVWLPPAADRWPAELRNSVLSHELAHVSRRDAVTQWLANAAVAVHWFNPLVWMTTRALRAERERACDDAVLALGAAPDDYAGHLLDMVRALGAKTGPAPAMAMARRSQFEGRLLAILDRAISRAPVGTSRLVAAGAGAMALVLLLGGLRTSEAARSPELAHDLSQHGDTPPATLDVPTLALPPALASTAQASASRPSGPLPTRGSVVRPGTVTTRQAATAPEMVSSPATGEVDSADASPPPATPESPVGSDAPVAIEIPLVPPKVTLSAPAATRVGTMRLARTDSALLLDIIAAAEGISSSGDRAAVLERVASVPDLGPTVVTAVARAAGRMSSTSSRARVLKTLIRNQPQSVGSARGAVLGALSGDMPSSDFGAALEMFIKRERLDDEAFADALTTAAKMTSSAEKARVLIAAARHRAPTGPARAAYVKTAKTITNGTDQARVLSALLDDPSTEDAQAKARRDPPGATTSTAPHGAGAGR